jgi:RNA polymerase sigma-70 factor, ECF subfamily
MSRPDGAAVTVIETAWDDSCSPATPRRWQHEFEETVLGHRERLYRLAIRLCRNRPDAEDLVQETFLRAFRRFEQFTPGTHSLAWLSTILRNTFINHVTRHKTVVLVDDEEVLERAAASSGIGLGPLTPEDELMQGWIDDTRLARAVAGLPQSFRQALLLATMEGLSNREIAQRCEVPIGTVMSRIFRARRLLRRSVTAWAGSGRLDGGRRRRRDGGGPGAGAPVSRGGRPVVERLERSSHAPMTDGPAMDSSRAA